MFYRDLLQFNEDPFLSSQGIFEPLQVILGIEDEDRNAFSPALFPYTLMQETS
jgi:hypothetical protein